MKTTIKAGIAKYKEMVSSLFGKDVKDVALESSTDKDPKAKGLGVGDIGGLEEETGLIAAIARDGTFIAYDNGTVKDTETGLIWASKDNGEDINWKDAKRYCESYRGSGYTDWRMPTKDELAGIYDRRKKNQHGYHVTNLIEITACCPWADETRGSLAVLFHFDLGKRYLNRQSGSLNVRALPVRGGN